VFRLAYGSGETQTRSMAAALQIKYRAVEGGEINHTTRVTLLDPSGRVLASSSQLSAIPDPAFVDQIRRALK
jgi:protein SCO1/2